MKTLVLGASRNPSRYAYLAVYKLLEHGHEVLPVGRDEGKVAELDIKHDFSSTDHIDTITMYLSVAHQRMYYSKILEAAPRRIIFNPGAENPELEQLARQNGIAVENACTLVMLNTGQY